MVSDEEFRHKLENAEQAQREGEIRAEQAESGIKELEDQLQFAKTQADKCVEEKDSLIHNLHRQIEQQKEETKQYVEQVDELEEYVASQEACFTTQLAGRD